MAARGMRCRTAKPWHNRTGRDLLEDLAQNSVSENAGENLVDTGVQSTSGPPRASSFEAQHQTDLDQAVLKALERRPVTSHHALRKNLAVQNERLGRTLMCLKGQGQIQRGPDGWRLSDRRPVPCSPHR